MPTSAERRWIAFGEVRPNVRFAPEADMPSRSAFDPKRIAKRLWDALSATSNQFT
jgi:hypothetical protein